MREHTMHWAIMSVGISIPRSHLSILAAASSPVYLPFPSVSSAQVLLTSPLRPLGVLCLAVVTARPGSLDSVDMTTVVIHRLRLRGSVATFWYRHMNDMMNVSASVKKWWARIWMFRSEIV